MAWVARSYCSDMTEIGIGELRNHLSHYLERVRAGEDVVVTDCGRAVARVQSTSGERTIDRLIREGPMKPAKQRVRSVSRVVRGPGNPGGRSLRSGRGEAGYYC